MIVTKILETYSQPSGAPGSLLSVATVVNDSSPEATGVYLVDTPCTGGTITPLFCNPLPQGVDDSPGCTGAPLCESVLLSGPLATCTMGRAGDLNQTKERLSAYARAMLDSALDEMLLSLLFDGASAVVPGSGSFLPCRVLDISSYPPLASMSLSAAIGAASAMARRIGGVVYIPSDLIDTPGTVEINVSDGQLVLPSGVPVVASAPSNPVLGGSGVPYVWVSGKPTILLGDVAVQDVVYALDTADGNRTSAFARRTAIVAVPECGIASFEVIPDAPGGGGGGGPVSIASLPDLIGTQGACA